MAQTTTKTAADQQFTQAEINRLRAIAQSDGVAAARALAKELADEAAHRAAKIERELEEAREKAKAELERAKAVKDRLASITEARNASAPAPESRLDTARSRPLTHEEARARAETVLAYAKAVANGERPAMSRSEVRRQMQDRVMQSSLAAAVGEDVANASASLLSGGSSGLVDQFIELAKQAPKGVVVQRVGKEGWQLRSASGTDLSQMTELLKQLPKHVLDQVMGVGLNGHIDATVAMSILSQAALQKLGPNHPDAKLFARYASMTKGTLQNAFEMQLLDCANTSRSSVGPLHGAGIGIEISVPQSAQPSQSTASSN